MVFSLIRFIEFIKSMIAWRRTKRCMAGYHKWQPKDRAYVKVMKCQHCPAEYIVGKTR